MDLLRIIRRMPACYRLLRPVRQHSSIGPGATGLDTSTDAARGGGFRGGFRRAGFWYWLVGQETFCGCSGWLDSRGSYYRGAQDVPTSVGHAVYAIGGGAVWESCGDAGGYGTGGSSGPCTAIATATAPLGYGQVAGAAYWTEAGLVGGLTFRFDLATSGRSARPSPRCPDGRARSGARPR